MIHSFRDQSLYYSDIGSGPVLLLLHGYLESSEIWTGFAARLSSQFRIIAPDLPGHGRSSTYGEVHTMEFLAESVKSLLDDLGIASVCVAGHSFGGYVTLAFLDLYPEMLSGYCLFHSHPNADSPAILEKRETEIGIVKMGKKDLVYPVNVTKMFANTNLAKFSDAITRSKEIAARTPDEGTIAVLRGMMQRPSRARLVEEGRVPCLWMLGEQDNYISHEAILEGINLPGNARVVKMKHSGHMGFIEEEDLAVHTISEFLKKTTNDKRPTTNG